MEKNKKEQQNSKIDVPDAVYEKLLRNFIKLALSKEKNNQLRHNNSRRQLG